MVTKFGVSVSDETADRLTDYLDYGDSRSEWIEEAIEMRMSIEEPEKERAKA